MITSRRLHGPGLAFAGVTLLVGFAAMNGQINLLFWLFGVLVSMLVISAVLSTWMMHCISVRRIDPEHGAVGEPLIVRYAVTNRSRILPLFNVHLAEQPSSERPGWNRLMPPARAWLMHLGPRETAHGEAVFWPDGRGDARFDRLRIWTTFPFGIVRRSRTIIQPQHTLIYPRLYELDEGVLRALSPEGAIGTRIAQHAGAGDDYFGTREHRPGDSLRHIAWKRSACLDQLVVIERTSPSPPRLRVALDLSTPTEQLQAEPSDRASLRALEEQAISLAASIVHAADLKGFEVGLTVWGSALPAIPVRASAWHRWKIMAALSGIDLDTPRLPREARRLPEAERAALVVVHPDRVRPQGVRSDAWHLTARQMGSLTVRAIGWDPQAASAEGSAARRGARRGAARAGSEAAA